MCEYCGCKAVGTIERLTLEHDKALELIDEAREAYRHGERIRLCMIVGQIDTLLTPHAIVEERGLFPAMAADFPVEIAALEKEHHHVEAVLAELRRAGSDLPSGPLSGPDWPERLMDALTVLRRHIIREQEGVFPAALSTLGTEEWLRLETLRALADAEVA
jgi:hemerythrin-like domain-containing protein